MAFIIAFAILFIPSAIAGIRWSSAQVAYIRVYRERRGVDLPLPGDLVDPIKVARRGPALSWLALRASFQPQPEPDLEALRRRALRRYKLTLAVAAMTFLISAAIITTHPAQVPAGTR